MYNLKLQVDFGSGTVIFSLCRLQTKCHEYPYRLDALETKKHEQLIYLSMDLIHHNESSVSNTRSQYQTPVSWPAFRHSKQFWNFLSLYSVQTKKWKYPKKFGLFVLVTSFVLCRVLFSFSTQKNNTSLFTGTLFAQGILKIGICVHVATFEFLGRC